MAEEFARWMPEQPVEAEIVIKKSRFIGHILPARSIEEAEAVIAEVALRHKAANHNCYAYTVGLGVPVERFSDAGEPSGTAGRPILEVLRKRGLVHTAIVVTRYFGGTLLGANGLVRAYTDASVAAVEAAELVRIEELVKVHVTCEYGAYGRMEYALRQLGHALLDVAFAEQVTFALWVTPDAVATLRSQVADWTGGQARFETDPPRMVGIRQSGEVLPDLLA
ncbi:MAG: IMPACT family protein [Alicyclobacillus sp.]|nr:IMPACT family protein [Alicyclobacillus sp.]